MKPRRVKVRDDAAPAPTTIAGCFVRDRIDLPTQRKFTEEGYLKAPARLARTGVYRYTARELGLRGIEGDREVFALRPDDEVFHPDAVASFEAKPATNSHPAEDVNADNWRKLVADGRVIGEVTNIARDDQTGPGGIGYLTGRLLVRDKAAIKAIESGKSEISNGYTFDADMTPGVWNGQKYDLVQRRIRGNHVAVVDTGRAGPGCRIADQEHNNRRDAMETVTIHINGIPFRVPASDAQAATDAKMSIEKTIADCSSGMKAAQDAHGAMKTAHDKMAASIGSLKDRFGKKDDDEDDTEKKGKDSASLEIVDLADLKLSGIRRHYKKALDAKETELGAAKAKMVTDAQAEEMAEERATVIAGAKKLVGDEFVAKGKTVPAIRAEAVGHVIAKDAALKTVAEAGLCGAAVDKAPADRIASVFAVLVASKGTARRATDAVSPGAGGGQPVSALQILAHDSDERRQQAKADDGDGDIKVIDMTDAHAALRENERNGGRTRTEEAGA